MGYSGRLAIAFSSDWHCGTGAGRHGGIDRQVTLDDDGLPYIPGRTLKGLWRDACERVAGALDNGSDGGWSSLARQLFGDPSFLAASRGGQSHGLVHVRDAHLTSGWRERLLGEEWDVLAPGLRFTRAGVAISDESGTTRPDHLRFVEFARGGLDLEGIFTVDADKHWEIDLLLGAGLRELTAIGSHRRRGAGRCDVTTNDLDDLASLITSHRPEIATVDPQRLRLHTGTPVAASTPCSIAEGDLCNAGRLLITLRQPVVVTRAVLGNLMPSHDYIPGATMLPIVVEALGDHAASLIRAGQIIVRDAVPAPGGVPLAKTPLCLLSGLKGSGWLVNSDDLHDARLGFRDASDRPIGDWATVDDLGAWHIYRATPTTSAHASIDDDSQRTLENGVYSLQAIPAGTVLACDVWLPSSMAQRLEALPHEVSIGRYRHDSYGQAALELLPAPEVAHLGDVEADSTFSLWLTADTLLLDDLGNADATPAAFVRTLSEALTTRGVATRLTLDEAQTFTTVSRRESWTSRLASPRPSLVALGAGSVVTLRSNARIPGGDLRAILDAGIGHRRAEGYGRAELLAPECDGQVYGWASDTKPRGGAPVTTTTTEPAAWHGVRRAIWRAELQRRLREEAARSESRADFLAADVTASNLGTLRTAALDLVRDPRAVDRWIEATSNHQERGESGKSAATRLSRIFGAEALTSQKALVVWFRYHTPSGAIQVPADLGGNSVAEVASWLLIESLRQQTRQVQAAETRRSR